MAVNPLSYTSWSGSPSAQSDAALRRQYELNAAKVAAQNAAARNAPNPNQSREDRIRASREEMYGLARGRVGELREDPVDQEVLAALRARATGQDVPFNETTTNALFTQQAEMGAQAQRNELDRIKAGGGSVTDPAMQARIRAAQARSDAGMQRARMGVDTQANLVNYDARGQALGQTGAFNQMRNQGITSAEDRLLGLLSREDSGERQEMQQQGWTVSARAPQQQPQQQQQRVTDMQRYFGKPWTSPKQVPIYGKPKTSLGNSASAGAAAAAAQGKPKTSL